MSEKEEQVLNKIIAFYKLNKVMPSIRYLQKELGYKSTNSIYLYLKTLEKKNYLTRNSQNKLILTNQFENFNDGFKTISIINTKEKISLMLNKKKDYLGFKIQNNYFINDSIKKNDFLIIELTQKLNNNDLGLFLINKKYYIMKYFYKDGFYILKDNKEIVLNKVHIIGKVILIQRNM